ncbi:uncharacterized protein LOC122510545 [Leptopilina heterotoma]|uniref:uncharacterized protein LOC122510545 n=1 Tax=Leptopilina heterotoma TaxID=63436 RepID=UPI001CA848EA|nr:uncharacterized protein LOC122510545 [Leptopilina heterotoma]
MSEDYQYACQRAELLGLPTPSQEEWANSEEAQKRNNEQEENSDIAKAHELDETDESTKRVGGGLDELNSILSATQKKINRFKTVCGSLGTLLKVRSKSQPGTPEHKTRKSNKETSNSEEREGDDEKNHKTKTTAQNPEDDPTLGEGGRISSMSQKKIDINQKIGSHIDKLDSLINKAENAQFCMQHQTKQMKKILK